MARFFAAALLVSAAAGSPVAYGGPWRTAPEPEFDRESARIRQLLVAVYTPMKPDQSLDVERVPAYAKWLAERNVTVVMPAGTNGESLSLSVAERKQLAEAWAKAGPPLGLKIYPHVGAESIVDAMELAEHAANTEGITGILAMTPLYFKPTAESLVKLLAKVAAKAPKLPMWYYHFPDDTGVLAGQAHKVLELAGNASGPVPGGIPNLMGVKFTDYNLMDFGQCTKMDGGRWNMLFGRDEEMLAGFEYGADAAASSTVNYLPVSRNTVKAYFAGDRAEAFKLQQKVLETCSLFGPYGKEGHNVQKNIMRMAGLDVGPSRLPQEDLTEAEFAALKKTLEQMGVLDHPQSPVPEAVVAPTITV